MFAGVYSGSQRFASALRCVQVSALPARRGQRGWLPHAGLSESPERVQTLACCICGVCKPLRRQATDDW